MSFNVVYQMSLCYEFLGTILALIVPLSVVTPQMHLQVPIFREGFVAVVAFEGLYPLMLSNVNFQP